MSSDPPATSADSTGGERVVEGVRGSAPAARRFLGVFLGGLLASVTVTVLASVWSNHFGYFGERGQFLTYNDRLAKSEYLATLPREELARAWVLGSSNTMPFQPATVERLFGLRTFNLGSYWGRVEDLWCWLNFMVHDLGHDPELVILGIEPWTFGANEEGPPFYRSYRRRLLNAPLLRKYLDDYHPALLRLSSLLDAISIQNLKIMAQASLRHGFARKHRVPLGESVFEADGTSRDLNRRAGGAVVPREVDRFYAEWTAADQARRRELEPRRQELLAQRWFRQADVRSYLPGGRLDPASIALFRRVLDLCQERGIEVLVVMLPVHPHFYDYLVRDTAHLRNLSTLRKLLAELQATHPVLTTVLDASRIGSFGGDPFAFHDKFHMTPVNTDRVLEALARAREAGR